MVSVNTLLIVAVVAAAAVAAAFRHLLLLRLAAVGLVLLCSFLVAGALIAPHRLAAERVGVSSQSDDWQRGARDTRDAVYRVLPLLGTAVAALAVLALVPPRAKPTI